MNNAPALLLEVLHKGTQLSAEDGELRLQAAKGTLTPSLRERLSESKPEVIALLEQGARYSLCSFAQQRLWLLDQLEPGSSAYNMSGTMRLRGRLEVGALERSLQEIVRRHEVLRTRFEMVGGEPVQVISPALPPEVSITDLSGLAQAEREAEARRLAREEGRRPYDLERGPLFRAKLLKLGEEEHVLLVGMHHIVSDRWSLGVFWREFRALYKAFSEGKPSPLAELPIQYADYAVWQREWLRGGVLEEQLGYWKEQLSEVPALELPTDRPRPAIQTHHGASQSFTLPASLTERLKELAHGEGTTLFMVLLAAFQALLSRYSGQDDVAVGTPIAGRKRVETEGLIGFFINTLVMRTDLSGDPSFKELLSRVREVALGAYAHQDLPFEKLVEELNPERDPSRTPLFQVMFALQNVPRQAPKKLPGLRTEPLKDGRETAKFDLTLFMVERSDGLRATFEYNTDLFDFATIERMLGHYRTLLEGVVVDPERRVSELELLNEAERHQLLFEWNDTRTDFPRDRCVHELFEEQAERTPEAIAVVFGEERLSYRELNRRSNQLAYHLRKLGVGPEVSVGICVERSAEMVVGQLGILKAGGAYMPLDPSYPAVRLKFMIEDAQAPVILTQDRFVGELPECEAELVRLDADWPVISQEEEGEEDLGGGPTPDSLAYVIYTSGSTGKPKGVCVPHRAINRLVINTNYVQLTTEDVVAQVSNAAFDAATWEIWGALLNGARLVVVPKETVLSPPDLAARLKEHGVSAMFLTTALFNQVAREDPKAFSSMRHLLVGGEAVEPRWAREVLVAGGAPERLLNGYGPTETTTFAICYHMQEVEEGATTIPIGRPIANTEAYVLDAKMQPVPIGVPGELYIGGPGLARGYLRRPELTAQRFVANPFSEEEGARLYRTGDLVRYMPDGNLVYLGRIDHQVKLRGFRIELGEIESVLRSHAGVRESVVVLREDTPEQKFLAAYVVADGTLAPSARELRAFVRKVLPEYMVPSAFVVLDELPLNPNGKVDRRALPVPERPHLEEGFVAPRTPVEERVAEIWADVLRLEQVGAHSDFFELGGHSLQATQVISRVRKAFQVELSLRSLFEDPTVAGLAERAEVARQSDPVPSIAAPGSDEHEEVRL